MQHLEILKTNYELFCDWGTVHNNRKLVRDLFINQTHLKLLVRGRNQQVNLQIKRGTWKLWVRSPNFVGMRELWRDLVNYAKIRNC